MNFYYNYFSYIGREQINCQRQRQHLSFPEKVDFVA